MMLSRKPDSFLFSGTRPCVTNLNAEVTPPPEGKPSGDPNTVDSDAFTVLKNIRLQNLKNIIIGQLNINSLRNKFYDLAELIKDKLDILVITETK